MGLLDRKKKKHGVNEWHHPVFRRLRSGGAGAEDTVNVHQTNHLVILPPVIIKQA